MPEKLERKLKREAEYVEIGEAQITAFLKIHLVNRGIPDLINANSGIIS